ncbi:MAG: sugar phosphate isomerase/epimerase [Candidatus Bathyarchaeota archaeon]|nr:sugar phosphate isomerase/epimerase [Candidatus Bathyarchaeota archaeon]
MIKVGCAAYSYREYFKNGTMTYEDFIEEAYRLGLDGVELTLYYLPSKDPSYFRKLKRLALARGLSISGAGIKTDFCRLEVSEMERTVETVEEGLNMACGLGAPCLRVFGGRVPEGHTLAEATRWAIEGLKSCVGYAEEKGVVMALENHGGITARADNVIKIVEEVDSPWFGINLDLGNYHESTYDEIAMTVPYAVHTHAKVSASGGRKLDYRKIKDLLYAGGYNGFLSIEYEERGDAKTGIREFTRNLFDLFR